MVRDMWQDRPKVWTGRRTQKGYQDNQRLIQDEFARTHKAALLAPIMTSPSPRWNTKWRAESAGRVLYGATLPGSGDIASTSFTVNVWDGCWPIEQCDEVIDEFVTVSGASLGLRDLGASPSAPTEALLAAAHVVVQALPHLAECGVPFTIAFRAMAVAINAIGRCRSERTIAPGWLPQQLALGF